VFTAVYQLKRLLICVNGKSHSLITHNIQKGNLVTKR